MTYALQKSLFLCDYWTKSDGVFGEMQIDNYLVQSYYSKTFSDQLTISKDIDAESLIIIFFLDNLYKL